MPPSPRTRERAALLAFFLPLVRRTCDELGIGDTAIAGHLAEVLTVFARAERLQQLASPGRSRTTSLVDMLAPDTPLPPGWSERDRHRHAGDYALFLSGLFRPWVERGGFLGWYLTEGARCYARVAALGDQRTEAERLLFTRLAVRFEHWSGALDYLRKVRFPGLAGRDPMASFRAEVTRALGTPLRN